MAIKQHLTFGKRASNREILARVKKWTRFYLNDVTASAGLNIRGTVIYYGLKAFDLDDSGARMLTLGLGLILKHKK